MDYSTHQINEHKGYDPTHREIVHEIKKLSERNKGRIGELISRSN